MVVGTFGELNKRTTLLSIRRNKTMTLEHLIVGATGVGYLIVGVLQWSKGELSNGMIWTGYAFAQVGLWMNIK
jgi:hypothetical protein